MECISLTIVCMVARRFGADAKATKLGSDA